MNVYQKSKLLIILSNGLFWINSWQYQKFAAENLLQDDLCVNLSDIGSNSRIDRFLDLIVEVAGGPLICLNKYGAPVLSGIVSYKTLPLQDGYPGLFSNIYTGVDYIIENIVIRRKFW